MKITIEYIWLGGGNELRSKTKIMDWNHFVGTNVNTSISRNIDSEYNYPIISINDIPIWDYDGSSTDQALTNNSEVILKPCAIFRDPFRRKCDLLVLCSTYDSNGDPLSKRDDAVSIFNKAIYEKPWYGIEQEYFIYDKSTKLPLEYSDDCVQGQYYCSNGLLNAFGRQLAEEHMVACMESGLNISGINAEVAPGQWEYQIGPCEGIAAGDQLWISRFLLERITEKYNVYVSFEPKPLKNINGSGCHTNFSTKKMRTPGGIYDIYKAIDKLKEKHEDHMAVYGEGNELRLTGHHETSSYKMFKSGNADRSASIRIGTQTIKNGCGYFEDRRPASNMDPYLVTSKIFETCCL